MHWITRFFIFSVIAIFCTAGGFAGYTLYSLPDVSRLTEKNPSQTKFMQYRVDMAGQRGEKLKLQNQWVGYDDVPTVLKRALIVSEDASFWVHEGFDWHEVEAAWQQNWEEGKIVRGASTISQQTAKNIYLTPHRSVYRKLKEILITRDMEKELPKKRILELYMNCIEFGDGIFGIRSAANHYFSKEPDQLRLSEIIRLVAIIPSPLRLHPNNPDRELKWRTRIILNRLKTYDFISYEAFIKTRKALQAFFNKPPSPTN